MSDWILDASALLALLNREPGEQRVVDAVAAGAMMSAVNLSEVISKLAEIGMPETEIREAVEPLGLTIVDFDVEGAFRAGLLRPATRPAGLSLGDRACLALGSQSGIPVLTADQGWSSLHLGDEVEIAMIR